MTVIFLSNSPISACLIFAVDCICSNASMNSKWGRAWPRVSECNIVFCIVHPFKSRVRHVSCRALQSYNPPGDWARELFKASTHSASLVVEKAPILHLILATLPNICSTRLTKLGIAQIATMIENNQNGICFIIFPHCISDPIRMPKQPELPRINWHYSVQNCA